MGKTSISDLLHALKLDPTKPIAFTEVLDFPEADKSEYPWLAQRDRFYLVRDEIGSGGFSLAASCVPSTEDGKTSIGPVMVIKIPNFIETDDYADEDIIKRIEEMSRKTIDEWDITRDKLRGCKHANPIIDFTEVRCRTKDTWRVIKVPLSVQPFLHNAWPLKKWLVEQHQKTEDCPDENGVLCESKDPVKDWQKLVAISSLIAEAIASVHDLRVTHGDIWPPNIFIEKAKNEYVRLIDFGEASTFLNLKGEDYSRRHPFLAPERAGSFEVQSDAIDVYSFGAVLLYLVLGEAKQIPAGLEPRSHRGWITSNVFRLNPAIAKEYPGFIDVIVRCTADDPVSRPFMREIASDIQEMKAASDSISIKDRINEQLKGVTDGVLALDFANEFASEMVLDALTSVSHLLKTAHSELVSCHDSRTQLIQMLARLFGVLNGGDSWSTFTTPSVWQSSALGLDGRYRTASIEAVKRGVSIHRAFVITGEELGPKMAQQLTEALSKASSALLKNLGTKIEATSRFAASSVSQNLSEQSNRNYFGQFAAVVKSLHDMVHLWELDSHSRLWTTSFTRLTDVKGLYIGMNIVATVNEQMQLRRENFASVVHLAGKNKWLLVSTDILGRRPRSVFDPKLFAVDVDLPVRPELKRVRVYKSKQGDGFPKTRVIRLQDALQKTINIGPCLDELADIVTRLSLDA